MWNYYRDEVDDANVNYDASDGKSIKYKTEIAGETTEILPQLGDPGDADQPARPSVPSFNVKVTILLKYLNNFLKSLDLPLMNCKVEFDLSWTKDCVLIDYHNTITGVTFMITSTKLYVPVATLSINDNIKF